MKKILTTVLVLILGMDALTACKSAPTRPTPKKRNGSGAGPAGVGDDDGGGGGGGPTTPRRASEKTFDKILLTDMDCSADPLKGKASLRLLTRDEYQNTLKDILKVTKNYIADIPKEGSHTGFANDIEHTKVTDKHLAVYTENSLAIANEVRPKLNTLAECTEDQKLVCAEKVIRKLGPLLWRRPLTEEEMKGLAGFYTAVLNTPATDKEAMTALFVRLLTSPNFLYRSELGKDGALSPYELANALSYFFWGTVPDKDLLDKAKDGTILNEAVLLKQTERLLADSRSTFFLRNFGNGWLGLTNSALVTKDPQAFPNWKPEIPKLMVDEAYETLGRLARDPKTRFKDIFLNDYTYGDPALAKFYNAKSISEGGVNRISFTDTPRRGLLGLGAILSTQASQNDSNPFRRGEYVLNNFLCYESPPPPPGRPTNIPPVSPNATTRERFAAHSNVPGCSGCHIKIDGIGFGMEDYDAVGLYRNTENQNPLDVSGTIIGLDGTDEKFNGTGELSEILSKSRQAKRCFVVKLYRFAHGREESPKDVCAIRDVAAKFESSDMSLSQLIIQIITHKAFQQRGE